MSNKKMDRREFLKVVIASAAAAGLSHFRFLNFGGALSVLADGCENPPGTADTCNTMLVDYCNPGEDFDVCPDPNGGASSSDVCVPDLEEPDMCDPAIEYDPDLCDPANPVEDICASPSGQDVACQQEMVPDVCGEGPNVPDVCDKAAGNPDVCPDAGPPSGDGDICIMTGPGNNADECIPAVEEPDLCSPDTGTDFCRNPETNIVEPDNCADPDPDICYENGQNVVDVCNPTGGDPDLPPNATKVTSFKAHPATATLGVAAVVGAVATLVHAAENEEARPEHKK